MKDLAKDLDELLAIKPKVNIDKTFNKPEAPKKDKSYDLVDDWFDNIDIDTNKHEGCNIEMVVKRLWCAKDVEVKDLIRTNKITKLNINQRDNYGRTLLGIALFTCSPKAVSALVKLGANVNAKFNGEPMIMGFGSPNFREKVQILVSAGANINATNHSGWTALTYWSYCGVSIEHVEALLDNGADPNSRDNNGRTPLMHAIRSYGDEISGKNVEKIINLLLQHGADPKTKDNFNKNYLDFKGVRCIL